MHPFAFHSEKLNINCITKVRTKKIIHQLGNHVVDPKATSKASFKLLSEGLAKKPGTEGSRIFSVWASEGCSAQVPAPIIALLPTPLLHADVLESGETSRRKEWLDLDI